MVMGVSRGSKRAYRVCLGWENGHWYGMDLNFVMGEG